MQAKAAPSQAMVPVRKDAAPKASGGKGGKAAKTPAVLVCAACGLSSEEPNLREHTTSMVTPVVG